MLYVCSCVHLIITDEESSKAKRMKLSTSEGYVIMHSVVQDKDR